MTPVANSRERATGVEDEAIRPLQSFGFIKFKHKGDYRTVALAGETGRESLLAEPRVGGACRRGRPLANGIAVFPAAERLPSLRRKRDGGPTPTTHSGPYGLTGGPGRHRSDARPHRSTCESPHRLRRPSTGRRRHRPESARRSRPARPRRLIGEPVGGQRPGPKPPTPRPGRTPSPDAGPPRPPGL